MFHIPLRVVSGYPGSPEAILSVQRGEIDGRCGWSWSSLMSRDKYLLDNKQLVVALQLGVENSLGLPGVPLAGDLTNDPKEKAALKLIFSRPYHRAPVRGRLPGWPRIGRRRCATASTRP